MKDHIDAKKMLERAYVGLVEDTLKKGDKRKDSYVRCCKCQECNTTLKKLYNGIYACVKCINQRAVEEALREAKKQKN